MEVDNILFALALTLLAGLSTGIGSAMVFFTKRTNTRFLSVSLGFSAGVMVYVSFVEILSKAREALETVPGTGAWPTALSFFGGMAVIALIDKVIPANENPHEMRRVEDIRKIQEGSKDQKLMRMGFLSAIAIAIHNFPEGLATFTAALHDTSIGIPIAIAIAIHNIPEGIAVSVPVYYATGNKRKAFAYSFLSGLAEPVGAIVGYFFLLWVFTDVIFGVLFAAIAGIMVFISFDQLLPAAEEYGEHHLSVYGLISGMAVIAVSLLLLS